MIIAKYYYLTISLSIPGRLLIPFSAILHELLFYKKKNKKQQECLSMTENHAKTVNEKTKQWTNFFVVVCTLATGTSIHGKQGSQSYLLGNGTFWKKILYQTKHWYICWQSSYQSRNKDIKGIIVDTNEHIPFQHWYNVTLPKRGSQNYDLTNYFYFLVNLTMKPKKQVFNNICNIHTPWIASEIIIFFFLNVSCLKE